MHLAIKAFLFAFFSLSVFCNPNGGENYEKLVSVDREAKLLTKLGVTSEGLSSQQADSLLEKHGKNVLEESKKKSVFQVFLSQFARPYGNNPYNCGNRFNVFRKC